jgi:hypothetical protein
MPAVLADEEWAKGEEPATVDEAKACLKTVEGVRWGMEKEERGEEGLSRPYYRRRYSKRRPQQRIL